MEGHIDDTGVAPGGWMQQEYLADRLPCCCVPVTVHARQCVRGADGQARRRESGIMAAYL